MATIERTPTALTLRVGAATLVLDKAAGTATLRRKGLLWDAKPVALPLGDICRIAAGPAFDRSCGFASSHLALIARSGLHLTLPASGKDAVDAAAQAMREFLGLS